jgi:hypothetical protein
MDFYAEMTTLEEHGLPGRCLWRHCLLFLAPPQNPPATRADARDDDCIGVVWLHNPSSRNRPRPVPQNWGRLNIDPPIRTTLGVIAFIMDLLTEELAETTPLPQSAYVAIEELVYIDSPTVDNLWRMVPRDQIERFSYLNITPQRLPRIVYPRSKFIWAAWGEKTRYNRDFVLPSRLTIGAMGAARRSGRDVVAGEIDDSAAQPAYSAYRYAAADQSWSRYHRDQQTPAGEPDPRQTRFPLHPYDFGTMLQNGNDQQAPAAVLDLVHALAACFPPAQPHDHHP